MRWSEWIECVLKERKEGSSWSVEVVVIAGLGRHFQLAGCRLLTARWDSVGCGEYVVQCMQFTDTQPQLIAREHPALLADNYGRNSNSKKLR